MAESTFLSFNINLQNTRNLSLSNQITEMSFSIWDTYILLTSGGKHFFFLFLETGL